MAPADATAYSLERIRQGEDTISVTGNVLRDYNTDLFPILELGTSAKMLSVVPLMNGGGLFETGAGGSAPKHVQQLVKENYLRWDSLGEFFALAASLRAPRRRTTTTRGAKVLADTLDRATGTFLNEDRSPGRKLGTHRQPRLALLPRPLLGRGARRSRPTTPTSPRPSRRSPSTLRDNEQKIVDELLAVQGQPADIGGYYRPDDAQGRGGHAPVGDAQRGARHALTPVPAPCGACGPRRWAAGAALSLWGPSPVAASWNRRAPRTLGDWEGRSQSCDHPSCVRRQHAICPRFGSTHDDHC